MPQPWPDSSHAADLAACRASLRNGSRSFHAASRLLPKRLGEPAAALYAFCRVADDEIDLGDDTASALARLHDRLDRAYRGEPLSHPVDRAFAEIVDRFALPRTLPEALLEGFAWDAAGRRYETLSELTAYAARVAGTVGAMMAVLMDARSPEAIARACDLGVAMQLTNIARDVGEDARCGRLYLPLGWLRDAGIEPDAWLADPVFTPAIGAVVQRLLLAADGLYARAEAGIAGLPFACRPGITAARVLYAEIGRAVERQGLDSVSCRAVVPGRRKAILLAGGLVAPPRSLRHRDAPPLAEVQFLVDAVAGAPPRRLARAVARPWWDLDSRVIWLLDLFERLERREQPDRTQA